MAGSFDEQLQAVLSAREPKHVRIQDAKDAAILIPIVAVPEPTLIFTVRTDTLPSHKGQISFPGGKIDATDDSPRAAALRESEEEIGLDPGSVRVLGEMDSMPTFVSGYVVHPFIGWLSEIPSL